VLHRWSRSETTKLAALRFGALVAEGEVRNLLLRRD
jgi:hypothetical protein